MLLSVTDCFGTCTFYFEYYTEKLDEAIAHFHKYIKHIKTPACQYFQVCWRPKYPFSQDTNDEKTKETVKLTNKKNPASKPPPKQPKERVVKPKKEVIKPGKPVKPDPTAKAKVVGHQSGVVRGITYYKAAKTDEDEHRGGESFQLGYSPSIVLCS